MRGHGLRPRQHPGTRPPGDTARQIIPLLTLTPAQLSLAIVFLHTVSPPGPRHQRHLAPGAAPWLGALCTSVTLLLSPVITAVCRCATCVATNRASNEGQTKARKDFTITEKAPIRGTRKHSFVALCATCLNTVTCLNITLCHNISTCGRRKSTRLVAVAGGLVTALGCLFTSFASQFHQLFFSYGIMIGEWISAIAIGIN